MPDGEPLVIGVDDTIERRRGGKIRDKGIYRDPVRSSRGFFVKVEGLRWLSLQVLARPGFATRTWGLPFLTILSRSERADAKRRRRHQTVPEKAIWGMRLVARWCPDRRLVMVGDGAYASLEVFWTLRGAYPVRGALPDGRALLQPTAAAQDRSRRAAARGRHPSADAKDPGGAESDEVGAHDRSGMADQGRQDEREVDVATGNGAVERARQDRAGALGADQGPGWARRDARVRLLRP